MSTPSGRPARIVALLFLLLIVSVAVLLRIWHLDRGIFSADEAFSWRLTRYSLSDCIVRSAGDVHPPLYFIALKCWIAGVGSSPFAMRLLSVLIGVANVILAVVLVSRVEGRNTLSASATLAATFIAVHWAQIEASRTARMYSIGVFFAGASMLATWEAVRSLKTRWWLAAGALNGAFCYVHYFAWLTVASQMLYVLVYAWYAHATNDDQRLRRLVKGISAATIVLGLMYAPWATSLVAQINQVNEAFWIESLTSVDVVRILGFWFSGLPMVTLSELGIWIGIVSICMASAISRPDRRSLFFLVQAFAPWVLVLAIPLVTGQPLLRARYMLFSQFSFALFMAFEVPRIRFTSMKALLLCFMLSEMSIATWEHISRLPEKSEVQSHERIVLLVNEMRQPHDALIFENVHDVDVARYFFHHNALVPMATYCYLDRPLDEMVWGPGHFVHISSLEESDVLLPHELPQNARRLWEVGNTVAPLDRWVPVEQWRFESFNWNDVSFDLSLFQENDSDDESRE